ncbi:hypothetical protein [Shimia aestuarii]|uniref:hypothetical protein n=1 Tax=Shimia aestuarii TaxID=254406 RepID=UPI001FB31F1C|nr:hypothetical protein [Shimia aestuarii]
MDLGSGLSAASTAIGIVRELREIDRSVDEAAYKLKLAELTEALADAKLALTDAKVKVADLEMALADATSGEICPKCKVGRLQLVSTRPKLQRGLNHFGVEVWDFQCDNSDCAFESSKLHDPHGVLPAEARKK